MDRIEMLALITDVPDHAREALEELKRLERAGWIDVTCYALLERDTQGAVRIQEASDSGQLAEVALAAAATPVPAGMPFALETGAAPAQAWPDWNTETVKESLHPGDSGLMLVLEERYSERVLEELETRGRTLRKQLGRSERVAALRACVDRARMNVNWLLEFLRKESAKASRASGNEKEDLDATVAAGRAELGGEREKLHGHLKALVAELETELRETKSAMEHADVEERKLLEARIGALDNAITVRTHDLVLLVLDHIESLSSHARELEAKAAGAGPEAAKAIDEQLHELEVRSRKFRAELTATLGLSTARARRSLDRMRIEASSAKTELRRSLEDLMKKLDRRHAIVKADLRRLERDDIRAWQVRTVALRKSWCALFESADLSNSNNR